MQTQNVLIVTVGAILLAWLYRYALYWRRRRVPTIQVPWFKSSINLLLLKEPFWEYIEKLYRNTDEKFAGFFMLHNPSLLVKDLDLIKAILVKDFQYFPDRTLGRNPAHDKLGANILFLTKGYWWKFMRSKVTQAYSTSRINLQIPLMQKVAERFCDYLEKREGEIVDIKEVAAKYSTDMITMTAYGIDGRSFTGDKDNYRKITSRIFSADMDRSLSFMVHYMAPFLLNFFGWFLPFLDKESNKRLEKTYFEQMKIKKENGVKKHDFLDFLVQLCEKQSHPIFNLDDNAMVAQAAQYFLAGYETISSGVSYMLYELAKHPQYQTRLRDEIETVLKRHNNVINLATLKEMTYLDMVLSEVLRMYPVLPFLDRKTVKTYKIPDSDVTIEAGTNIYISTIGMHYDPQYFPEPDKFDPERFAEGRRGHIHPFTYLPVGVGPRICIGARYGYTTIKMGIVRVLKAYSVATTPQTPEKITYLPSFLLVPAQDINLRFNKI